MALSQYYDNTNTNDSDAVLETNDLPSSSSQSLPAVSSIPVQQTSKKTSASRQFSNIRTLNDMSSKDDDPDSEPQNFFAGGEKSGMLVQDPSKRNKNNNLVDEILKKAAAGGAAPEESSSSQESKPSYFTGSGYKLGSEEEPSVLVDESTNDDLTDQPLPPVTRYLTFWRNGFSVDDGPLLRYDDPANAAMLSAINSGRAPLSLLNVQHGQPVDVRVAKRQDEDYVPPPKAPPKPFEGAGHRLGGSSAPSPVSTSPAISSNTTPSGSRPEVDPNQPTTSLQIRLGDGSRLVAKFNHTHTVGDIRRYIEAERPSERPYILQTTFPVKELKEDSQSLKDAGLLNSVVVQRYQ
ncbi:unnamed protein product [Cunninghamella blakesleeana]